MSFLIYNLRSPLSSSILHYAVFAAIALTAFVVISSVWNVKNLNSQAIYLATEEARTNWNKDQAFRRWATRHGGLYVKPDERTPPNPYLEHLPHRDVETTDGVKLTLMNPAYMMSQMTKEFEAMYGVKGKITGQILLNPANEADPWELNALKQFDKGVKEVSEQANMDGQPYIRLMRPMVMKEGCVLCHGHLGFKVGDIRGGVSISIPLTPYFDAAQISKTSLFLTHGIVWLIGMLTIGMFSWRGQRQEITRRQAENALREAHENLKAYSIELEQGNKELQSFASIASHDLQEPLRKIVTFGDRLATRIPETDEQGRDYLNRMQNSALRMRNLVEDLLQYTRVENKQRAFESLDLNKVVLTVLDDLETRISETQGAVNIVDLPVIEGDPVQIYQLFLNLIGNALKFYRDGIPPVVNLDSSKMENGFWGISVEDNGIGIEEEHVDKIFKPFERLHGRTTYEGTGIGLSVCNKIVKRHGGTISVKRQSVNGVTFHITLPEKQNNAEMILSKPSGS